MGWTTKTIRKSGKHDIGSFDVFHLILADNHADIWHDMNSSPLVELDYHAHFKCGDAQNKSSSTVPNRWAKLKLHLIGRNVHLRPMLIFNFKAGGCLKLSFVMLQLWECGEIYLEGRGVTSNVNLFGSGMSIEDSSVKPLSCIPYSKTSDWALTNCDEHFYDFLSFLNQTINHENKIWINSHSIPVQKTILSKRFFRLWFIWKKSTFCFLYFTSKTNLF